MKLIKTIAVLVLLSFVLDAQESGTIFSFTEGGLCGEVQVKPWDVLDDVSVTFRLYASRTNEVLVNVNWPEGRCIAMIKSCNNVWKDTTGDNQSELWTYTFSVDGIRTIDASNYNISRYGVGFMNTVLVPRDMLEFMQAYQMSHGIRSTIWTPSTFIKVSSHAFIYRLLRYEGCEASCPVLYLLHGRGGDEDAWPAMGIASIIMDQLIVQAKASPMIAVMPNTYWNELASFDLAGPCFAPPLGMGGSGNRVISGASRALGTVAPTTPGGIGIVPPSTPGGEGNTQRDYSKNVQNIVGRLIPVIEKNFQTLHGSKNRAIAGLSMGSQITANAERSRLDVFWSMGLLSSGMFRSLPGRIVEIEAIPRTFLKILYK